MLVSFTTTTTIMEIPHVAATIWKANEDRFLVILPLFFTYALGSYGSLRVWLAVQNIPAVKSSSNEANLTEDDDMRRFQLWFSLHTIFLLALLVFTPPLFEVVISAYAINIATLFSTMGIIALSGPLYVSRGRRGLMSAGFEKDMCGREMVIFWLAFNLSVAAIWFRSNIGASVMVCMAICTVQLIMPIMISTLRHMTLSFVTFDAILLLFLVLHSVTSVTALEDGNEPSLGQPNGTESEKFYDWIFVFFSALPLSSFIAMTLRFDFANHLASVETIQGFPVETLPVPAPKGAPPVKQRTGVVPSTVPVAFSRPYFLTALTAWLITNVVIMGLIALGVLPDLSRFAYTLYLLYCAPLVVVLSVVVLSVARGEGKRMWSYEENWSQGTASESAG